MLRVISCIFNSPRLHRIYALVQANDIESTFYKTNVFEKFGDNIIRGVNIIYNIGLYSSPFILSYLYQKNYFCATGCVSLVKFATGLSMLLFFGMVVRGLGRVTNAQYTTFLSDLHKYQANPTSIELKKSVSGYDFDLWAMPTDFSVNDVEGEKKKNAIIKSDRSFTSVYQILGLPCYIMTWCFAHLFGRHIVYPGSVQILQYAMEILLQTGRQKLILEHSGSRNKVATSDGNLIDTMFVDRRKSKSHHFGSILVICCEGNAGFYEFGIMNTPLEAGYSVLGWNHPGFAGSTGTPFPSEDQNAVDSVVQFAIEKLHFNVEDIIVYGWSIGGYSASYAAMMYPEIRGLILDATFDDILPLALPRMPSWMGGLVKRTVRNFLNINNIEFVRHYTGPLTIIRRTNDEMITTSEGVLSTNRGNNLLVKVLQARFPNLFLSNGASDTLQNWVSKEPSDQDGIYRSLNIDPELCLAQLVSYSSQEGEKYPMMIGADWKEERTKMLLFIANKYFVNSESTHNAILESVFFRVPWAPILDSSYVQLE